TGYRLNQTNPITHGEMNASAVTSSPRWCFVILSPIFSFPIAGRCWGTAVPQQRPAIGKLKIALPVRMGRLELLELVVDLLGQLGQRVLRTLLTVGDLVANGVELVGEERIDRRGRRRDHLVLFQQVDPGLHQRYLADEVLVERDLLDRWDVVLLD